MIGITKTSTIQYQISFIQSIDMSVTAIEDSSNTIELSTLEDNQDQQGKKVNIFPDTWNNQGYITLDESPSVYIEKTLGQKPLEDTLGFICKRPKKFFSIIFKYIKRFISRHLLVFLLLLRFWYWNQKLLLLKTSF